MIADLAQRTCAPCQGGIAPLGVREAEALRHDVPAWTLIDDATRLERRYTFEDFRGALAFVNAVGDIAEREGHHPDVSFGWGYAIVSVFTHKINGLHENDFILAAKCDAAFAAV